MADTQGNETSANKSNFQSEGIPERTDVGIIAFQQPWVSIGKECKEVFAPEGLKYVEISPPQESIKGSQWWTSYQPVSYRLDSKLGTEEELQEMIDTCRACGVEVIADVVFNQTTAGDSEGTQHGVAGTPYRPTEGEFPGFTGERGEYPEGLNSEDFHDYHDGAEIEHYDNQEEVQQGKLESMWDFDSESEKVQDIQSDYLVKLYNMGVRGFRMDASKHIHTDSLNAIKAKMAEKLGMDPGDIYWIQEVIATPGEAEGIQPQNYLQNGTVTQFTYMSRIKDAFTSDVRKLDNINEEMNQEVPSEQASVFVANWDTERNGSSLSYKDGVLFELANAFLLANDYGTPRLLSDYRFQDGGKGAPLAGQSAVPALDMAQEYTNNTSDWNCEQRWPSTRGMIAFHNAAYGSETCNWQTPDSNILAFDRGGEGFFAINNNDETRAQEFHTGMPDGEYKNLYNADDDSDTVTVQDGVIKVSIPSHSAIAIVAQVKARS